MLITAKPKRFYYLRVLNYKRTKLAQTLQDKLNIRKQPRNNGIKKEFLARCEKGLFYSTTSGQSWHFRFK